jgi:hypothetical protein
MSKSRQRRPSQFVEVARSFSYKLNMDFAGVRFESRDFFCSQKSECRATEAESVSDRLYAFCKLQVLKAVAEYRAELEAQAKAGRDYVNERKAEIDRWRLASARTGASQ